MKERLKAVRQALGYTQAEFAERLGIAKSTVSQWESGVYNIQPSMIILVCNVFGVSRKYMENGEGEMFARNDQDPLEMLCEKYRLSEADKRFINVFCNTPPKQRQVIRNFMAQATMDDCAYSKT